MEDRRKNLREFLVEEQEPFDLKIFIAERKQQLQRRRKRGSLSSSAPPSPSPASFYLGGGGGSPEPAKPRSPILVDLGAKATRRPAAAFLLVEAAMRVAAGKKRKSSRGSSMKGLGIAIFGSILGRLAFRKRVYELEKEDEEKRGFIIVGDDGVRVVKEAPLHPGTTSGEAINGVQTPDAAVGSDEDEDEKEASFGRSTSSDISMAAAEPRSSCSSSSAAAIGSSSGGATPESSPPASFLLLRRGAEAAAAADQLLKSQTQLFSCRGGDNGGGSSRKEKEEEEHEQFSPASVLEPIFDDTAAGDEDDDGGKEQEAHLRGVIRRLDELEEEEEEQEQGEASSHRDLEKEELVRIVRIILDGGKKRNLCGSGVRVPRDVEMLVCDVVGEERSGSDAAEVEEAVWRRMETWDEDAGDDDVERAVEMDLRSKEWRRCRAEAEDVGDAVEFALLELLVCELSGELLAEYYSCCRSGAAMSSCALQEC